MIRKLCNVDQLPEEGKLKAMQDDGLDLCVGVLEASHTRSRTNAHTRQLPSQQAACRTATWYVRIMPGDFACVMEYPKWQVILP